MVSGETKRGAHKGCSTDRTTATVHRTPAGWVLHCFKCGASGFDHARVAHLKGDRSPVLTKGIPGGGLHPIPLTAVPDAVALLAKYGIDWLYDSSGIRYDEERGRLCFPLIAFDKKAGEPAYIQNDVGWVGKSLTRMPKWYLDDTSPCGEAVLERAYAYVGPSNGKMKDLLVLTEDPISALKITKSDDRTVGVAMLGLALPAPFVEVLGNMSKDRTVVVWPDGDAPGIKRGAQIFEQLNFIRPGTKFFYELNKDPKDLTLEQLGEHLARIREAVN